MIAFKTNGIPKQSEIATQEQRLKEMLLARDRGKKELVSQLTPVIENITDLLPVEDATRLFRLFEAKIRFGKKNQRGTRVPPETKERLVMALRSNKHTLGQLESIFGLSISYIASLKKQLGLTHPKYRASPSQEHAESHVDQQLAGVGRG